MGHLVPLDATFNRFYKLATWKPQFAWWPQRCAETNRLIWLTTAYLGVYDRRSWNGQVEYAWLTPNAYLIAVLKDVV